MNRIRRWTAVLGFGIAALAIMALFADRSVGRVKQPPFPPVVKSGDSTDFSSVTIFEDRNWREALKVGRECIAGKEWDPAVTVLQKILALENDHFVRDTEKDIATGKDVQRWTSVKFAANNLLGSMDMDGLEKYEQKLGSEAKTQLDDAKQRGDMQQVAEVAQKYCHTKAGIEANEILATLFMARGQVFTAALRYEKLLRMNPEWAKVSDLTLYKAALAFRRAGDKKNADDTWERLQNNLKGKPGLKVGQQVYPIAKLQAVLDETQVQDIVSVHDWQSWRGNILNTAQANGSPPLLDVPLWKRPIFRDALDGSPDRDDDENAEKRVLKVVEQVEKKNEPVLPGFFPIVSQGIMVYRNHRGLVAVALKDTKIRDEETGTVSEYKAGQIIWKSIPMDRSLAVLLEKPKTSGKIGQWLNNFETVAGFGTFLYDNTLIGTVMTDQRNVYAINDLGVPPHPAAFNQNQFNPQFNQYNLNEIKPLVAQNELYAYDLITGKLKWDLNHDDKDFKDSHFLSLPITVAGKLYLLNEKLIETAQGQNPFGGNGWINPIPGESELRLVCIDPTKISLATGSPKPTILEPIQVLGNVRQHNRFVQDMGRRVNAVQLAYGEGILVCPTNAGEVFGIDLMTRSLVWSYSYRDQDHRQIILPGMPFVQPIPGTKNTGGTTIVSKWKSAPPAIQDGRIVFTAPDADSIHCVNLRDGRPVWKKPQAKGDQFMAGVYKGRVLIVSDTSIRALDLKDGRQVWTIHTGDLPSGQGVASKDIYYLPLKKGEILAVDVVKGQIKAHNRAAGSAPGNLVFYDNMVLSQTVTEVAAYPQLSARLESARIDSAKNPADLVKLTDYGELLLKDGQVHKATEALLKVYDAKPADPLAGRAKQRLFESLTDLMQVDFNTAARDYLAVYKTLCEVPDNNQEEQSRKARFFRLVGQGREAQGKLVEAFQMYKAFGALPMNKDSGIASPEDPNHKVPVNVWLRGRISGMMARATAEQREPLEVKIAEEWKAVEAKKDIDSIRSFVGMFDVPFRVGREARVKLAETIMDRNDRTAFLEAELSLYQVMGSEYKSDAATGGRALAALALLEEKKGTSDSMRLAAAYYRQLKREFENAPVRGTKTGANLFDELATDKRFLPFLEEPSNPFGPGKISARNLGAGSAAGMGFSMIAEGDQTPFARLNRLILNPSNSANPFVRLSDSTGTDRWTTGLGHVQLNQYVFNQMYQGNVQIYQGNILQPYNPNARHRFYHVKGHLIVCQVGVMVYCLDGDSGKKLWEMPTVEQQNNGQFFQFQGVEFDRDGNPKILYWNQQMQRQERLSIGRVGAAQASYVAVLGQKGLTVVDPLRGGIMWKRPDVAIESHVFGDDQYLFLADSNGTGGFGVGLTLRASDGEVLNKIADFSPIYQHRIRTRGRQILAAQPGQGTLNLRLYDILSGKDIWTKQFPLGSYVLKTEDPDITGILDPLGQLTVLDVAKGNVLVNSNIIQARITLQDLKGLENPLLLHDADRYYVALNKPIDRTKIDNAALQNNFQSGARSLTVNGWFLAVHRHDGKKKIDDRDIAWKKGDLAWHSYMPITNQLVVVDQFEQSPVLIFTTRYKEFLPNGGFRWGSYTQSLSKPTGKMVYDSGYRQNNGQAPMFQRFQIDLKGRAINLIGLSESVQHYLDDGKAPPPMPPGAMLNPRGIDYGASTPAQVGNPADLPVFQRNQRIMRRPLVINDGIEVIRDIEVKPLTK